MSLTITSDLITSDRTAHTARPFPGCPHVWQVTWLPGHALSPSGAVTAMILADAAAQDPQPGHRIWPHISTWAAELGLTASAVIVLVSTPPSDETASQESGSGPDRKTLP